jgi:hypothetical protein
VVRESKCSGLFSFLYLLIKEVRFLPTFFVRFSIAPRFQCKLQSLPPVSYLRLSCRRPILGRCAPPAEASMLHRALLVEGPCSTVNLPSSAAGKLNLHLSPSESSMLHRSPPPNPSARYVAEARQTHASCAGAGCVLLERPMWHTTG